MSKTVRTYEDLLNEEQRLLQQISIHEQSIKNDIAGLKNELKPLGNVMKVINKIATRDHTGPLMNFGLDFGVDLIIRKLLLARAGWLTKIVIPFIIKNYSSHIISEEKRAKLTRKLQEIFNKIRPKTENKSADAKTSGSFA